MAGSRRWQRWSSSIFYNGGGIKNPFLDNTIIPLELTAQEKGDLVAFLRSLNGEGWQQAKTPKTLPQ
jgi:cytochrome c peroxidase